MYSKNLFAGWGEMDFNAHMGNTAYLDKAVDVRMMFFSENGFPASEFSRLNIGPVILKEEIEYYREIRLLEEFSVTLELAGLAPDGGRFRLRNEFFRPDGERCTRITTFGGWLDLSRRKLIEPPAALITALHSLTRTEDFEELRSRTTKKV
jgi:acyl-CoA thioester hydrolase